MCSMYQYFITFNVPLIFHHLDIYPFISWRTFGFISTFLATMHNAAMNIHTQVFVWIYVFNYLGYIPKTRIAGSYDDSV